MLVSYPKTTGAASAPAQAAQAAKAAALQLPQVGVLDSSELSRASNRAIWPCSAASTGRSKADADAAVSTARQAGLRGARYARQDRSVKQEFSVGVSRRADG